MWYSNNNNGGKMNREQLDLFKLADEVEQIEDKKIIDDEFIQHQIDTQGKIGVEETE
tara:strand:+ start:292 stop:462 length:171 start_codon:yes stop_codon:yes gene_type:complete